ncbi:MAG: LexA family transcriptional regulator [Phycisphaerales bacterium]
MGDQETSARGRSAAAGSKAPEPSSGSGEPGVASLIRTRRRQLSLTLDDLAARVGCAKGYLSQVENARRGPPSDTILAALEQALDLPRGRLVSAAGWERTPPTLKRDLAQLQSERRLVRRLADLAAAGSGSLDEAFKSGELRRLVETLAPMSDEPAHVALPLEVPLINSVSAGYPTDFTDMGYPARVADEYVRCPDLHDPDAFAARVVGDSMEPDYREGDIVVFSPARDVRQGADCFVRLEPDHESTFKRVYFESGEGGAELIRIQPVNPEYPPRVVPREQVAGLYPAVSVTRSIQP